MPTSAMVNARRDDWRVARTPMLPRQQPVLGGGASLNFVYPGRPGFEVPQDRMGNANCNDGAVNWWQPISSSNTGDNFATQGSEHRAEGVWVG